MLLNRLTRLQTFQHDDMIATHHHVVDCIDFVSWRRPAAETFVDKLKGSTTTNSFTHSPEGNHTFIIKNTQNSILNEKPLIWLIYHSVDLNNYKP